MKVITLPFTIILLVAVFNISGCQDHPKEIDVVQNKFDPLLGANQRKYRLWIEAEDVTLNELIETTEFNRTDEVSKMIDYFMGAIKQIRIFVLPMQQLSTEYGTELNKLIENEADKERFMVLWREFQESVVLVMDYDIQLMTQAANYYSFYRNATVEEDGDLVFVSQEMMDRVTKASEEWIINDDKLRLEQQEKRSETLRNFKKAIDFAKENAN